MDLVQGFPIQKIGLQRRQFADAVEREVAIPELDRRSWTGRSCGFARSPLLHPDIPQETEPWGVFGSWRHGIGRGYARGLVRKPRAD